MGNHLLRCEAHNLAVGPDDLCVVCRRERNSSLPAPPMDHEGGSATRWLGILLAVIVVGGAVTAVAFAASSSESAPLAEGRGVAPHEEAVTDPIADTTEPVLAREPSDVELAAEMSRARSEVRVELYSTSWCPHCRDARDYLNQQGITFTEYDVDHDEAAKARLRDLHPSGSIPYLVVDGSNGLSGFSERAYDDAIDHATQAHLN